MAWAVSSGRDISHYQAISDYTRAKAATDWVQIKLTEGSTWTDRAATDHHHGFRGIPRGAYHFARPTVGVRDQVAHFLARKVAVGPWERPDMLDAEIEGTTGAFVRDLIDEYRRQSGRRRVLVYTPISPDAWGWDPDVVIWRARYRKAGPPPSPDDWPRHLGWDHPGLGIYQWDDAWPWAGGPPCDINSQRVSLEDAVTAFETADATWRYPVDGVYTGTYLKQIWDGVNTLRAGLTDQPNTRVVLASILAAVTAEALDPDAVLEHVDTAVREATAASITTVVLPALQAVLAEALGDDNAAQAELILDRLRERLAA